MTGFKDDGRVAKPEAAEGIKKPFSLLRAMGVEADFEVVDAAPSGEIFELTPANLREAGDAVQAAIVDILVDSASRGHEIPK